MYLDHFGLNDKPFNITPNPQYIFLSKNHKEVFAHLLYGLESRCGFIEITGEVGAGKTTVLRTLFDQLEEGEFRLAFIFNPSLSAEELLLEICRELGIAPGDRRGGQLLPLINDYLLAENAAGRTVVLVIDEAQNLAAPVLEQIRLLSNLETETDKLIQIILVGQPELADLLGRNNLRQLNQRIVVRYHLEPMDADDSAAYIRHRLQVAGLSGRNLFTESAIRLIYAHSSGLPRLINILCDRSLLAAYSEDRDVVDRQDVKTAVRELQLGRKREGERTVGWVKPLAIAGGLALLVAAGYMGYHYHDWIPPAAGPTATASTPATQPPSATLDPARVEMLRRELSGIDETASFAAAARALTRRWHVAITDQLGTDFESGVFVDLLSRNGWQWTSFTGDFETLETLDTPVMLEITLPGVAGRRYLAITGIADGTARIEPALGARDRLTRPELKALYGGKAYFIWKNYLDIGYLSTLGMSTPDVRDIQTMLNRAGYGNLTPNGVYDQETIRAVTRFQAEQGIVQDGRVGPLTLLLLYQRSGSFDPPRLSDRERS